MLKKTCLILLACIPVSLRAQTADQVIAKYINYIGGAAKWKALKTISTSGEYNYNGIKFPFYTFAKAPNLYKFIVPLNGKYYVQAYTGNSGWKIDAFKNQTKITMLQGKEAKAMANEADVETIPAFIDYKQKGFQAILAKADTLIDDKKCHKLTFKSKDGTTAYYYFDQATGTLVMKRAVSKNAEMNGDMLNTHFSKYQDVGGVKIPYLAVSKFKDQPILTITITKASINDPVSNDLFSAENPTKLPEK